jgi:uncharacterized protein (DUF1800 family)
MQRRRYIQLLSSAALGALAGCDRSISELQSYYGRDLAGMLPLPTGSTVDADFHLLSRATFGPCPGDWHAVKKMGRSAWLEQQLQPQSLSDTLCDLRAERFESLQMSAGDAYEFRKNVLRDELTRHSLLRAIYSQRQLFEVMVEFWTDHLNIQLEKGDCIYLKPSDDRDVIRQHALGNFRDLIRASATSPAMLVYLDGKTNRVRKGNKTDQPNENYARELLELHTLGVHGGYSQQDVKEAARCLTGWTFDRNRMALDASYGYFRADWHDDGAKTVLGHSIPAGGGAQDLETLIQIVCEHPSTAQYISQKLCQRFVSAEPPAALVQRAAETFRSSGGHIPSVLRCILTSAEFYASAGSLLKRPFRYIVSVIRALAVETHVQGNGSLVQALDRMGQGLFQYPTPDGYPMEEAPWLGTLMWRWDFALSLVSGRLGADARVPLPELEETLARSGEDYSQRWWRYLLGRLPSATELAAVPTAGKDTASRAEHLGLILSSPSYQRH